MCNSVEPSDLTVQGTVTLSMFGICEALRSGTKIQTKPTFMCNRTDNDIAPAITKLSTSGV